MGGVLVLLAALGRLLVRCGRSCGGVRRRLSMSGAFASAGRSAATVAAAVAGRVVVGLYALARKNT